MFCVSKKVMSMISSARVKSSKRQDKREKGPTEQRQAGDSRLRKGQQTAERDAKQGKRQRHVATRKDVKNSAWCRLKAAKKNQISRQLIKTARLDSKKAITAQ